jgi:putative hemolysin
MKLGASHLLNMLATYCIMKGGVIKCKKKEKKRLKEKK